MYVTAVTTSAARLTTVFSISLAYGTGASSMHRRITGASSSSNRFSPTKAPTRGADAAGARGFVEDDDLVRALQRRLDGFPIHGLHARELDEVGVDALGVEFRDGFLGFLDAVEVGDDGDSLRRS